MTLVALALLAGSAWTIGTLALRSWSWPELRAYERFGLELISGLGLVSLMLALLALSGLFFLATPLLVLFAITGVVIAMGLSRTSASGSRTDPWWVRAVTVAVFVCAAVACVGAITPVVDYDALSYVMPIASRIAETGRLRVWSDQARSMWPLSHEMLLAYVLRLGGHRLIAVTALEWIACVGAVSALARRACSHASHVPVAVVIALAAPVVAFQISTAKEDLLLVAATAATGFCLVGSDPRDLVAAGLFAGIAAGTKYPGLGVALATVAWVAMRHRRVRPVVTVAGVAFTVGGLWYVLNLWRFGNPVAPFVFGARGTPLDTRIVRDLLDSWGLDRQPLDFVITPIRLFLEPNPFLGTAALFNPLAYLGIAGLAVSSIRRRNLPLTFTAAVLYVGWFFSLENARLLLPAAVLLSPAAADVFVPIVSRWRPLAWASAAALAVPLLFIPLVGVMRVVRYARDPAGYVNDNTQHYADLVWANTHLDPHADRILSFYPDVGYLEIPYLPTAPTYQMEMSFDEIEDPALFLNACRRQGITHLYARSTAFPAIASRLRVVYDNPQSLLGGEHFFRAPRAEHTSLFEILP
jgi:hypothetical protein